MQPGDLNQFRRSVERSHPIRWPGWRCRLGRRALVIAVILGAAAAPGMGVWLAVWP